MDETDGGCKEKITRYINNLPETRLTRAGKQKKINHDDQEKYPITSTSFDQMSTSDYSSNNSNASRLSNETNPVVSPLGLSNSPYNEERRDASEMVDEEQNVSDANWDSDSDAITMDRWEQEAEYDFFRSNMINHKGLIVKADDNVCMILPPSNIASLPLSSFKLSTLPSSDLLNPRTGLRVHHISPIVQTFPSGRLFSPSDPARIYIPLDIQPSDHDILTVLTSPNLSPDQSPIWEPLAYNSYICQGDYLILHTCTFALFTVIYQQPEPVVTKRIRKRIGGTLRVENKGFQVEFPRGSCPEDIDASLKIFYDYEPETIESEDSGLALACPVIMLGPHGYKFNPRNKPVEVELPVPHYKEIKQRNPDARLMIFQSSTLEGEPLKWYNLEVDRQSINEYPRVGLTSISFPVYHFSFFKVMWDILADNMYKAKMGVSYFYPWVSFPMKCQAYMEENPEDSSFGLEVICYNSENNPEQVQTSNYRYCVGSNLKPRLVRPGRILIKLRSQKFRAHIEVGEDDEMEKEEPDFRGRDFEKQFACIFNEEKAVERGTFGKVVVNRTSGNEKEELFNFNLNKTGIETEAIAPDSSDRWSIVAVRELAGHLNINRDIDKITQFARYIGFTSQEIRSRLQNSPDPFLTMMNVYQQRGGTPEEFVEALYSVSRDLRMTDGASGQPEGGSAHSSSSGVSGSGSQQSRGSGAMGAPAINKRFSFFGLNPWRNHEDSDSGTADMQAENSPGGKAKGGIQTDGNSPGDSGLGKESSGSRKRVRQSGADKGGSSAKKRKTGSLMGLAKLSVSGSYKGSYKDDSYSSSDESGNDDGRDSSGIKRAMSPSTVKHKRNPYKLSDQDLWQISSSMNAINWRALGRTLGLEESVLLNLEHAHKGSGFRECAYQMLLEWKGTKPKLCTFGSLYHALTEEKMNGVAKHMTTQLAEGNLKIAS